MHSDDFWHVQVDGWRDKVHDQQSPVRMELVDASENRFLLIQQNSHWSKLDTIRFLRCPCHSFSVFGTPNPETKQVSLVFRQNIPHPHLALGIPAVFQKIRLLKPVKHTHRRNGNETEPTELIGEFSFHEVSTVCHEAFVRQYGLATHLPGFAPSLLRIIASYCKC
jgi:hypothetical protein